MVAEEFLLWHNQGLEDEEETLIRPHNCIEDSFVVWSFELTMSAEFKS